MSNFLALRTNSPVKKRVGNNIKKNEIWKINHWTKLSIEYANQRSYLDDLFQVYPTIPEGIRDIDKTIWKDVENAFGQKDNDAINTIQAKSVDAVKIAILDGVLFIKGRNKMYKSITETYKDYNILSALVLREFLYQL